MKVLFAASEIHPLIKTGGLADVAASLPLALHALGVDIRLILPAYPQVVQQLRCVKVASLRIQGRRVHILQSTYPHSQVPIYLVASTLFEREGNPYVGADGKDWPDNPQRFGLFCRAVVALAQARVKLAWQPQLVHCNDWQTGLVPALLQQKPRPPRTVFTVHNLAYQGLFPHESFHALALPSALWHPEGMEFHGQLSFIKGGLAYADQLTTVSPNYAKEIVGPEYGYGLEGLLQYRANRLRGILNGIDYKIWNPAHDPHLAHPYQWNDLAAKKANKQLLQKELGLTPDPECLLFIVIGRMAEQKGNDLILDNVPRLLQDHAQLAILGTGERYLEDRWRHALAQYPGKMAGHIGFDESLAHRMEAGGDAFLMPSRFEPCGLNQMYSLHYGTVPIVRATGGLSDTVIPTNPQNLAENKATGFVFEEANADALWQAIARSMHYYHKDKAAWQRIQQTGMQQDFSWQASAQAYQHLYESVTKE